MIVANACLPLTSATKAKKLLMANACPFVGMACRVMPEAIAFPINQPAHKANA